MNTLTDLLLGVGQPRVSHFPDLCTVLYTYLSTLDYWTKIVYYLFTQTSPVAHTSALTPTYIKSQKLPNWPISKELGLGRMLLPHWKLLFISQFSRHIKGRVLTKFSCLYFIIFGTPWFWSLEWSMGCKELLGLAPMTNDFAKICSRWCLFNVWGTKPKLSIYTLNDTQTSYIHTWLKNESS